MTGRVWHALERWRSVAFLAAGVSFLGIGINFGIRVAANMGVDVSPLVPLSFMLLVYAGLLGVSPRLVERAPRLGRVGQALVLVLGTEIVLTLAVGLLPVSPPRAILALVVATAMVGAALTVTLFGAVSLRTGAYARSVGGFLLLAAAGLYVGIASNILFGTISPAWISAAYNGLFGIALVAAGYVLWTEGRLSDQADSTETVA